MRACALDRQAAEGAAGAETRLALARRWAIDPGALAEPVRSMLRAWITRHLPVEPGAKP